MLGFTDKLVGWPTMRHPAKRALRDTLMPAAAAPPVVQNRAAHPLSQVSVAYPSSSLVLPDGARRRPKPGERVPDIEVRAGGRLTRLHRVLGRGRHMLLVSGVEIRAALKSSGLDLFAALVRHR